MILNKNLWIIGPGGHGKSVFDLLTSNGVFVTGFIDTNKINDDGEKIFGKPVLSEADVNLRNIECVIGVAKISCRRKILERYEKLIIDYFFMSDTALRCYGSEIGNGTVVHNRAFIGPVVKIGTNTVINTSVVVEHEAKIGNNCFIAPASCILGGVEIGDNCFVGANATILPNLKIAPNTVIGAGAVVTKSILTPGKIFKGVPAR